MEAQGNVLLASIENMQYAVTVDVLHTVSQIGRHLTNMLQHFFIVYFIRAKYGNQIPGVLRIWCSPKNCYF